MNTHQQITISMEELQQKIEPIIREELKKLAQQSQKIFNLTPDMPLYEDLEEISQRKAADAISSKMLEHKM